MDQEMPDDDAPSLFSQDLEKREQNIKKQNKVRVFRQSTYTNSK